MALRRSSSRQWLIDGRIRFLEVNLSDKGDLLEKMRGLRFDYVVHAAGVTKCLHREDFFRVNVGGTQNLVQALAELGMPVRKFVYVSSLSVFGPVREQQPYEEIRETDEPRPDTAYGQSKLAAEGCLDPMPWVVLRPTGV